MFPSVLRVVLLLFGCRVFLPVQGFLVSHTSKTAATLLKQSVVEDCDVAVFGGGFGGLYTALALKRESVRRGRSLQIALVEPSQHFVFLPLLYDLTVGTATHAEVCPLYQDLLQDTGITHIRAHLESIQAYDKRATLKTHNDDSVQKLNYRAAVVAVGASPHDILKQVPGALQWARPFYTAHDAKRTKQLLHDLETRIQQHNEKPRIAIVGGGFGGVELAASVKRRLGTNAHVALLTRTPPMANTRAEPLVHKALDKLQVVVEQTVVQAIEPRTNNHQDNSNLPPKLLIRRQNQNLQQQQQQDDNDDAWDAVLWTAGSSPSAPVPSGCQELQISDSGRLAVDETLLCQWNDDTKAVNSPSGVWSLGDCSEIATATVDTTPKTAQAAMQQAEIVANNVLAHLLSEPSTTKTFVFQDLGSMLTLGGPNAAVLAPQQGPLAPIFAPLLDTVGGALQVADQVATTVGRKPVLEELGLNPDALGLSLGSYGIGVETGDAPGTLAGTLTGAARRAVYAARMPTDQQRAVSFVSAAVLTAVSLAREASSRGRSNNKKT